MNRIQTLPRPNRILIQCSNSQPNRHVGRASVAADRAAPPRLSLEARISANWLIQSATCPSMSSTAIATGIPSSTTTVFATPDATRVLGASMAPLIDCEAHLVHLRQMVAQSVPLSKNVLEPETTNLLDHLTGQQVVSFVPLCPFHFIFIFHFLQCFFCSLKIRGIIAP